MATRPCTYVEPSTIYTGTHVYNPLDIDRALICSLAVYQCEAVACQTLMDHPTSSPFKMVFMSKSKPRFMVAHAEDAIFIAFPGTDSLEDIACNLKAEGVFQFPGYIHEGFYTRGEFNQSGCSPILGLLSSKRRVIFCGHSLGGAVAHVTLLRFLLAHSLERLQEFQDSLISIAFGAPFVCDETMASFVNRHLKWRFLTVVNQMDPIPRIMVDLEASAIKTVQYGLAQVLKPILRSVSDHLLVLGGVMGRIISSTGAEVANRAANPSERIVQISTETWKAAIAMSVTEIKQENSLFQYAPIGYYYFPHAKKVVASDIDEISEALGNLELTEASLRHHTVQSYKFFRARQQVEDCVPSTLDAVTSPAPEVFSAILKGIGPSQTITLKGKHLLFLKKEVKINGATEWKTVILTDEEIVACRHQPGDEAVTSVHVKTAFGETTFAFIQSRTSLEKSTSKDQAQTMLPVIVEKFVVKAKPPLRLHSETSVKILDGMLQCCDSAVIQSEFGKKVGGSGCNGDMCFRKLFEALGDAKLSDQEVDLKVSACKKMAKCISDSLGNNMTLKLDPTSYANMTVGEIMEHLGYLAFSGGAMVMLGALAIALTPLSLGAAAASGWGAVSVAGTSIAMSKGQQTEIFIDNYEKVLEICIAELSEQKAKPIEVAKGSHLVELEKLVATAGRDLQYHETSLDALVAGVNFKTKLLKNASGTSKRELLAKMKIVASTHQLWDENPGELFVGVFGPQNAGKSTFIRSVLAERGPAGCQKPQDIGARTHTNQVRPYQLKKDVWLLDYPGSNGAEGFKDSWKNVSALSSRCLLLLRFDGDITSDQIKMYEKFKDELKMEEEDMIVAFNQVDRIYREDEGLYTKAEFDELRRKASELLKCPAANVHYITAENKIEDEEMVARMRERGVTTGERLAEELLGLK